MADPNSSSDRPVIDQPLIRNERFRVEMTVGCQDAAAVPKVRDAGRILHDGGQDIQIMHNGVRVVAGGYYGGWMSEIIERLRGHHEPQEEVIFHEVMKFMPEAPSMIELGCFWAYYSLWMLQARPAASVIGVEPDAYNLDVGRRNAALNERTMSFIEASAGAKASGPQPFGTESSGIRSIPQVSVPQLMEGAGLAQLDLLHCDTQGAETDVLASCRDLLKAGAIRFCIVSTHHHSISGDPLTHQRCLRIMQEAGGLILAEHGVAESFSGDGLIAGYFGKEPISWPGVPLTYNRASTSLFRDPLYDLAEVWTPSGAMGSR